MSMWMALWAAPASLGFAMIFNVRRTALPLVAAIAVLAKLIAMFCMQQGLALLVADFLAAFVVGAIAYTIAPRLGEASPVFAFAPVIPLVPGSVIAKSFITSFTTWVASPEQASTHTQDFVVAMSSGLSAAAILMALCLGAISPMLLLPRARTAED